MGVRHQNESRGDAIESEGEEEFESHVIETEGEDEYGSDVTQPEEESNNVIRAFTAADEEDTDERPLTTSSGRAITKRSQIDFHSFEMRFV